MSRTRVCFRCTDCGGAAPKWVGRCPTCDEWNTLVEELVRPQAAAVGGGADRPTPIVEVDTTTWGVRSSGLDEFDRVLGGGFVPGSVTLLGGEPGIGKSTLLLQAAAAMASDGAKVLYVTAEESTQQVRRRAERLGALTDRLWLAAETVLPDLVTFFDELTPDVVVIDSIQTVHDPEVGPAAGSTTQVRECAARLVRETKVRGLASVLVGHVTKDGGLAGPRVLEHMVDTVLAFEGERHHALRLLRAPKHRFGSSHELGLFEMTGEGLVGVPDAGGLFLGDRRPGVAGSVVVPTMEGHRPLLVEVQALVVPSNLATPRRSAQGIDAGRLSLLVAVLQQQGIRLFDCDVFALAVGGVTVREPAVDLGLCLAAASSLSGRPLPDDLVVCGEVGLAGELRQVGQCERRMAEAARLGFRRALVPGSAPDAPDGISAVRATTLGEALAITGIMPDGLSAVGRQAPPRRRTESNDRGVSFDSARDATAPTN